MSVRYSPDPYDGFKEQLVELRGMVKIVPPLIEADRQRRWDEIGNRPGDPEVEMIYIYETEAGEEEGHGHALYDRVLYSTAIVMSWETFYFYCVRVLEEVSLRSDPNIVQSVAEERRSWDRNFDAMAKGFQGFGVKLSDLSAWAAMLHARELRNALVHNQGYYTERYVKKQGSRRLTSSDLYGMTPPANRNEWVNSEEIPLDREFAIGVINQLLEAAREIQEAVKERSKG